MVAGIGGVFLHSREPAKLAAWYKEVLGLQAESAGDDGFYLEFPVREAEGERRATRAVWAIFLAEPDKPAAAGVRVNYRVTDMNAMLASVRAKGAEVERSEDHEYGRFAWLRDPDGNEVELWEDAGMTP